MTGVVVIGSIGLVSAMSAAALSAQRSRELDKRIDALQARTAAYTCANVAMLRLRKNSGYGGNEHVGKGKDKVDCDIKPVGSNGGGRTVNAQSTVNGQTSRIKVEIQDIDYFFMNSWTEMPPQ